MRQHLGCVIAAAEISGAQVQGAELNSQSLSFAPGKPRVGDYRFHLGTAGSCGLLLQTLWPALMMANGPSRLSLGGGTHNPAAPPFHFLARSYAPLLARLGAKVELNLLRMGFYPAGGGEIEARIWPAADQLEPFDLITRGAPGASYAECHAPALPRAVARRELEHLGEALGWTGDQLRVAATRQHEGPGNALLATLEHEQVCEVFTRFGVKGLTAETVAQELARDVRAYLDSDAALGPYLADQWALPLALAVAARPAGAVHLHRADRACPQQLRRHRAVPASEVQRGAARGGLAGEGRTRLARVRARLGRPGPRPRARPARRAAGAARWPPPAGWRPRRRTRPSTAWRCRSWPAPGTRP